MAYLKFTVKKLNGYGKVVRAYAYESRMEDGKQVHFSVYKFGVCLGITDARERFKKWLKTYNREKILRLVSMPNPTLKEFSNEYLERNERLNGGRRQASMSLKHLNRLLGSRRLSQMSRKIVLDYRDIRKKEVVIHPKAGNTGKFPSSKTINLEISTLSSLVRKAIELERIEQHPFLVPGLTLQRNFFLKVAKNPRTALTHDEFKTLLASIVEERSRVIALVYAVTGMRRSELTNLRLADIDMGRSQICFRAPKTNDFRTIAIPTILNSLFQKLITHMPLRTGWKEREDNQKEYVFCNPKGDRAKGPGNFFLREAAVRAGIQKRVTPHILRHTFGSHAANQVNIWELKQLMGHRNISTTEIYVKNFTSPGIEVANKIAESLGVDSRLMSFVNAKIE
jgi:integrase